VTTPATATIAEASRLMRDERISSLPVVEDGELVGILTVRDLANRVVAEGRTPEDPVATVMTPDPATLPASALVADLLRLMLDRGISHVPLVEEDRLVGMVTSTDLTRLQALSTDLLTHDIEAAGSVEDMVRVTAGLETLLVRLVGSRHPHAEVTRRITDVADAVTRRLIALAEAELGPPPVPYVWAACGSQGRREQTGVTDQDNCLIIDDDMEPQHDEYFARLATIVSDGLAACGYVYCSGEMMATTPQWRQPLRTWREYFDRWIEQPDPKAQMLASVMFDLRPIAGDTSLFTGLQHDTLRRASANQIFVAHMISNSMLHSPPLTFLRGISTQRSGEHRHTIDLKLNGVIPIVDLGRLYALRGRLTPVNTRERLLAAEAAGVISSSGGRDLVAAYDVIATMRLEHQARCIADGDTASNFLNPKDLSDFERGHLREAFLVVKTMQSAIGQGTGMLR
jgi:CBS domain-containing protein